MTVAACILAGGRASRLGGGDKPLLPLGGATILDELLARLRPQAGALALSANGDAARFARFGLPVLPDLTDHAGPLAGVQAAIAWARAKGFAAVLTVPGDTPFIPRDLAARLTPAPCRAASAGTLHPLIACWPCESGPALAGFLAQGGRRVRDFGTLIGMRDVDFAAAPDPFFNINTPEDLMRARLLGN